MKIRTLLSQKEGPMWDFKSARVEPKDLAKILIAFANTDGGTVVIGVEKDRSISGIKKYSDRINSLLQTSINFIEPPIKIKPAYVDCRNKEGKTDKILLLEVSPSGKVHNNTSKETFIRIGDQTRKIGVEKILELAYDRGQANFEFQVAEGSSIKDMAIELFNSYRKKLGLKGKMEEILLARELAVKDKGKTRLTLAGALLFSKKPTRWLPKASIRFLKYKGIEEKYGREMNLIKDHLIADIPIPKLLDKTFAIISEHLREYTKPGLDGKFKVIPEYPEFAWQEAIVNAVAHRSYSITGSNIFVKMFDDRFAVISPGGLPGNLKKEDMLSAQFSRNPRIARVLAELEYIREMGEGLDRMFKEMKEFGLQEPEIIVEPNKITLILKNSEYGKIKVEGAKPLEEWIKLNERQKKALEYIEQKGSITRSEYMKINKVSHKTAHMELKYMTEKDLFVREGKGRSTKYLLKR